MEVAKYTERLVPSTRFVAVDGVSPQMAPGAVFVAPSASIIGDVTIGNGSRFVVYFLKKKLSPPSLQVYSNVNCSLFSVLKCMVWSSSSW